MSTTATATAPERVARPTKADLKRWTTALNSLHDSPRCPAYQELKEEGLVYPYQAVRVDQPTESDKDLCHACCSPQMRRAIDYERRRYWRLEMRRNPSGFAAAMRRLEEERQRQALEQARRHFPQ